MDHTNNKEATSPKDANHATEKPENPFVVLVNKKIKKVSKKMQRITALEAQLASTKEKVQINEDQKKLLETKEATQQMLKEFEELKTQMLKLLGETPAASKGEKKDSKKKDKPKKDKKKETKESAPAPAKTTPTPATSAPQQTPAPVEPPKPAETQPVQETKAEEKKEEAPAPVQPTAEKSEEHGEEGEDEDEEEGEFADKEALRKEWAAQKEVYVQKYKNTLKPEDENKYIAVHKGVLYGPCDTLQQLKEAQGGQKLEGAFLARVGHEDEPPVRRTRGFRGRGRGFRGRGRGGRGRGAPRGQSQQRS